MKNKQPSIDGFIPRRSGSQLGERHALRAPAVVTPRSDHDNVKARSTSVGAIRPERVIDRSDIDKSLSEIDEPEAAVHGAKGKVSRRERRRLKDAQRTRGQKIRRRVVKIAAIVAAVILLAVGGFLAYKTFIAAGLALNGNLFDLLQQQPLKQDANGRSNFLVLGTTDDDPTHQGNNLTDTIMVVSVDQKNKNAYMFSLPRDLYVSYGQLCLSGDKGKINAYFSCSNSGTDEAAEKDRLQNAQEFIGDILGMDIQYAVHVNSVVVRDAVDAVGGIDVDIQGSGGAPGVYDSNFDWGCNYKCYRVKYDNGVHHLNGEQAMYLAMARGDRAPTYGLGRSNFDREQNQQKIMIALKQKATSTGILTNVSAIAKLIDAVGNNLRTNVNTKEIRTIMDVANTMKPADIHTVDFLTSGDTPLFTTGSVPSAGSVVYPALGIGNYTDLRTFIAKKLSKNPVVRESATVVVLNGSETNGVAQAAADELEKVGFTIGAVDNAPEGSYGKVTIYQLGNKKTASAAKLKQMYGVELKKDEQPPLAVSTGTDFVVVIGDASAVKSLSKQ